MSSAMTFTSLCADVAKYVERGGNGDADVEAQLPSLVNMAERRIAHDLKVIGTQETAVTTLKAGVSIYAKPDRWRDTVSMNFGSDGVSRKPLYTRSYEYARNYWPNEGLTGVPRFYADYDNDHWLVVPTPANDYPMEVLYHQMHRLLDSDNGTNWLTAYVPNLLLFATLHELALFTRAFDQAGTWDNKYKESLGAINGEEVRKMADRTATRQGA